MGIEHEKTSELDETRRANLRSFLRAARERVRPEIYRLPVRRCRRTPGLRREEVAELAGVSTAWYTLLETARNRRVSTRMLNRVAEALMLNDSEKLRLYSLAFPEIPAPLAEPAERQGAELIEVGGLQALVRRLSEGTSISSLAEATVEFVWSAAGRRPVVAFLERDFALDKFRCVRFCHSGRTIAPNVDALYEINRGFLHAIEQRTTLTEQATSPSRDLFVGKELELGCARYLAASVTTSHCAGVLLYAEQAQEAHYSSHVHERLLLVADLLGLALTRLTQRSVVDARRT